jgi:hypothetical protein
MTTINLESFNVYLGIVLNALFVGFGTGAGIAIGTAISKNHILKFPNKIKKAFRKKR